MVRLTVDFWALDIRLELTWLRSYLELLERHLTQLPQDPPESIREQLVHTDQDVRQPTQQQWSMMSEEAAPRLARGSYVVALYAAYESAVRELAGELCIRYGAKLSLDDVRGRTFVQQARKYFDVVLGIPLCPNASHWSTVTELTLVRHVFAHANGRVGGLNQQGRKTFDAMVRRGDARESWGAMLMESQYLRRALDAVDESLHDLIERTKTPRLPAGEGLGLPVSSPSPGSLKAR